VSGGAPTPPTVNWTPEQLLGIRTTGRSLLVSAAAGSGKTAVLAQRCAHLVCDAAPPCDVDQLLVVTFTEAAAAEMKGRIERVLRQRLAASPSVEQDDPRLVRQLALIDRAHVSTLHGFCSRLLRQNFHLLGLDPGFAMLDGDEAKLLRIEVARQLFADRYENDTTGAFGRLVRFYGNGDDEALIPHLLRLHDMLCSLVEPAEWLKRARDRIESAATADELEETEVGQELTQLLAGQIDALHRRCTDAIASIAPMPGLEKFVPFLETHLAILDDWRSALASRGLDALSRAIADFPKLRLPTVKGDVPNKELAVAAIDSVRDEMGKTGSLAAIARFSREEWQTSLRAIVEPAKELLDLAEQFARRYRRAKSQSRRLDFNDLERYALRILREDDKALRPSGVARTFHQQFHHVLVDEYQDINEVQDAILNLVSRECGPADPSLPSNLFCVGDVKQSIYRFRLAEPQRFLERYARFKPGGPVGQVIDLQANFRSRAPLLNVLNELFARLMTKEATDVEYDESHYLKPGAKFPPADGGGFAGAPVELHLLPDDVPAGEGEDDGEPLDRSEREAQFVARRIRQLIGTDGGPRASVAADSSTLRPIQFKDIVILLRSMRVKADQYADALRAAGIPVFREGGQGYFQSMEVRDMRALLALLDNPRQDIPLAAVLRSPLASLANPEDCLARIRLAYRADHAAAPNPQFVPFHEAARRYSIEQRDELAAALRDFFHRLDAWRQLARHRPLAELIWQIYTETGYLAFCQGLANGDQRVANLVELHERATQFGAFSRQGLYRFLKFLDSLEAETDFGQPSVLSQSADVVRIMSVHHSKGLEFPVVFLPELGKRINLQDCQGSLLFDKRGGLALQAVDQARRVRYPSLTSVLVEARLRRQSLAEELRVLYVATTRAREHLILSGTCAPPKADQWASRWASHAGPMPAADVLAASTMLDWVGPAVAMIGGDQSFAVTRHAPDEVAAWTSADLTRPTLTEEQRRLARLEPLTPAPPPDVRAEALIRALTAAYPHAAAARLEAARSVTDLTKQGRAAPAGYVVASGGESPRPRVSFSQTLPTPRCLLEKNQLSAADVGSGTHVVLQHLDFARPCVDEDLAEQINAMVTRRLITRAQAKHVDLGGIEWFVQSDLARLIRDNLGLLRRELDFHLAVPPSEFAAEAGSEDPVDRVMVRGRLDALLLLPDGVTLIDYKTDRVAPELVAERTAFYRPQTQFYRRAVETITGKTVRDVYLVFLAARQVHAG